MKFERRLFRFPFLHATLLLGLVRFASAAQAPQAQAMPAPTADIPQQEIGTSFAFSPSVLQMDSADVEAIIRKNDRTLDPSDQNRISSYGDYLYGLIQFNRGRSVQAEEAITSATLKGSQDPFLILNQVRALAQINRNPEALAVVQDLRKNDPDLMDAYLLEAKLEVSQRHPLKAIGVLEEAHDRNPKNPVVLEELANLYLGTTDVDKIVSTFEQLAQLQSGREKLFTLLVLGAISRHYGKISEAINYYEQAIRLRPRELRSYVELGGIYEEVKEPQKALEIYKQALVIDSQDQRIREKFDNLLETQSGLDGLLKSYTEMAENFPNSPDVQLMLANLLFKVKRYGEAEDQIQKVLALDPASEEGLETAGRTALALGKISEAQGFFNRLTELVPENAELLMKIGGYYEEHLRLAEAQSCFEAARELAPASPELIARLGKVYLDRGLYSKAAELLGQAVKDLGRQPQLVALLGRALSGEGKTDEAIVAFQDALDRQPNDRSVLTNVTKLVAEKHPEQLEEFLTRHEPKDPKIKTDYYTLLASNFLDAKELDPAKTCIAKLDGLVGSDPELVRVLALLYAGAGETQKALEKAELTRTGPDGEVAELYLKAAIYTNTKDYDQARKIYDQLIALRPRELKYRLDLSDLMTQQRDYQASLAVLETAEKGISEKEISGDDAGLQESKAFTLRKMEQYDKAEEIYTKLIQNDEANDHYHYLLGALYDEMSKPEAAERALRRAVSLNPRNWDAYNHLGYMFAERGERLDEAEDLIEKALTIQPNAGYIVDSLGWVYYKQGKTDQAVALLERAVKLMGDDPVLLDHLGDAYQKNGNIPQAIGSWKEALQIDPSLTEIETKLKTFVGE